MKTQIYQIVHVVSMVLLVAFLFQAFANPDPGKKKRTMILTGVMALLMLIGGFGLVAVQKVGFPAWVIIKIVCWLGLASLAGFAFRKPQQIPALMGIAIVLIVIAVVSVYFKFGGSFE